jgi:flagellar P-ring protein precursor FlgI
MSMIENIDVQPGEPPARVVVNARTGTVVISRNVKVTAAAVADSAEVGVGAPASASQYPAIFVYRSLRVDNLAIGVNTINVGTPFPDIAQHIV